MGTLGNGRRAVGFDVHLWVESTGELWVHARILRVFTRGRCMQSVGRGIILEIISIRGRRQMQSSPVY